MTEETAPPFPPPALMQRVSGLTSNADFAAHGRHIFDAVQGCSPKPLFDYPSILDFGVGAGRLARMFQGYQGSYCGADVDHELVAWSGTALPWVKPLPTTPRQRLSCPDDLFDCVISISVFTHMNGRDALFYLDELRRVTRPDATLFLTVHGQRAADRAMNEPSIADMLAIPREDVEASHRTIARGGLLFTKQNGHLTTDQYDYGISFTSEAFIWTHWSNWFDVIKVVPGAIHDFQDIAVLRARGQ